MKGYVAKKGNQFYAVIYEGLDPVTGREKRTWHPAGPDRAGMVAPEPAGSRLLQRVDRAVWGKDGRNRCAFRAKKWPAGSAL